MQLVRRATGAAVRVDQAQHVGAAGALGAVRQHRGAPLSDHAQAELHAAAHAVQRAHELVLALGQPGGQVPLALELGAEAERQDGAARHDRLDDALMDEQRFARGLGAQRAMPAVDRCERAAAHHPQPRVAETALSMEVDKRIDQHMQPFLRRESCEVADRRRTFRGRIHLLGTLLKIADIDP